MTVGRWEQRVDVLGPVIVRGAGGIVPLTRSMEIAVLSLLALRAGSPVSGDSLIDLLWPDEPPRTATKTLQGYVKRVRSMVAVNGIALTHAGPAGYVLDLPPHRVDALEFESLVAHARTSDDDAVRVSQLDEALSLWRGEPFSGAEFEGLRARREWLLRLLSGTRVERVAAQIRLGVSGETLSSIRALLVEDPTNERLWLHLASAHYLAGNPVAALDAIAEARRRLDELVGVTLGPELTELQRRMLDHDDVEASYYRLTGAVQPPVTLRTTRRSVPTPPLPLLGGELIGRDDVVEEIVAAVDGGAPVVTVTGPGGLGKTRCAVEAARRAGTPCRGFVDLSALTTGADLALHLAGSIGVPDRDDAVAAVAAQLGGARVTVVLDNVEQIADAGGVIGELAQRCPSVSWLVTSQSELGLSAERVVRLHPLADSPGPSVPGRSTGGPSVGSASPAATLLATAARRRGVRVPDTSALEPIAALIGGIPLALELAACQLQHLDPTALLQSLSDPIAALVDPRQPVDRHRSMRACFELGRARLSADATDLLTMLSHRTAGAPYDDLLAWWSRPTPLPRAVAELVEAGFAATGPDDSGAARLTQLPLVRAYGRSLPRPADATAAEAALDAAVLGRVHAAFTAARSTGLESDLVDIRRLLQRGLDQPEALDTALQVAVLLVFYWWSVRITEGRRWLDALLGRTPEQPSVMQPAATLTAAFLDFYVGEDDIARRRIDEVLQAELADPAVRSRLLTLRAMLDVAAGEGELGLRRAEIALDLARSSGDVESLWYVLGNAGDVATAAGDLVSARELYVECLERIQRVGLDWLSAAPHARLGDLDLSAGEYRRARMWFDRSIALWSSRDLGPGAPQTLAGLARLDVVEGDLASARRHLDTALATAERCGSRGEYPWIVLGYAAWCAAENRPKEAAVLFGLGPRHGPRAGHHVQRLIEAELAPFYAAAVEAAPDLASDPVVVSTALEDLPVVVASMLADRA